MAPVLAMWQYEVKRSDHEWNWMDEAYNNLYNQKMVQCLQDREEGFEYKFPLRHDDDDDDDGEGNYYYYVNFKEMTQTNNTTGKVRRIRRWIEHQFEQQLPMGVACRWRYQKGNNANAWGWMDDLFTVLHNYMVEQRMAGFEYTIPLACDDDGNPTNYNKYVVSLEKMLRMNCDTGTVRAIRPFIEDRPPLGGRPMRERSTDNIANVPTLPCLQ